LRYVVSALFWLLLTILLFCGDCGEQLWYSFFLFTVSVTICGEAVELHFFLPFLSLSVEGICCLRVGDLFLTVEYLLLFG